MYSAYFFFVLGAFLGDFLATGFFFEAALAAAIVADSFLG
jgi:hypothetical protein